ncbi:MAG: beta propeller repeat protein, partial [Planctomycetota bacterium]
NGGTDWAGIAFSPAAFPEWNAVALNPDNPREVIISDEFEGSICKSTDGGNSWRIVFQHPDAGHGGPQESRHGFKDIAFTPSDPSIVYAGW